MPRAYRLRLWLVSRASISPFAGNGSPRGAYGKHGESGNDADRDFFLHDDRAVTGPDGGAGAGPRDRAIDASPPVYPAARGPGRTLCARSERLQDAACPRPHDPHTAPEFADASHEIGRYEKGARVLAPQEPARKIERLRLERLLAWNDEKLGPRDDRADQAETLADDHAPIDVGAVMDAPETVMMRASGI